MMKTTKHLLKSVIVLAMIVMVMFALASCVDPGPDHEHSYTPVVVDPTCTEQGFTTHVCECGDFTVDTYVNSTGHSYADVVTAPTCTEQGYTTHTCSACGDSKVDTYVVATDHNYGAPAYVWNADYTQCVATSVCANDSTHTKSESATVTSQTTNATCLADGKITYTATFANSAFTTQTYEEPIRSEGHKFNMTEWGYRGADGHAHACTVCPEHDTPVAHTSSGAATESAAETCLVCLYVIAPELEHTHSAATEWEYNDTHHWHDCVANDGQELNKAAHEFGKWTKVDDSTHIRSCECGKTETAPHAWDEGKITTEPTHTAAGVKTFTCDDCGATKTEPVEALGHTYVDKVVDPTCTEQGYTVHKCDCGDQYVDSYIAASGHKMESEITKEPTATESGVKHYFCTNDGCDYSYDDKIDSVVATLPGVSDILIALFGQIDYTLTVEEGSSIILINEIFGNDYVEDRQFIAINVGEVNVNTKGEVATGYLELEFGIANLSDEGDGEELTVEKFDAVSTMAISVNGDDVTVDILSLKGEEIAGEYSANELFYGAIANAVNMPYEQLVAIIDACDKVYSYMPVAEQIIALLSNIELPEISEDFLAEMKGALEALPDDVLATVTDESGNTVYTLNVAALADFLAAINEKSIADYIDGAYGDGTTAAISEFLADLPYMTVKEIVNSAIEIAEAYDIEVELVYELIENVIFVATGVQIDIAEQIEANANLSISEIVAMAILSTKPENSGSGDKLENTEQEKTEEKEEQPISEESPENNDEDQQAALEDMMLLVEAAFENFAEKLPTLTIDRLYNLLVYGDESYVPEDSMDAFSFINTLCALIQNVDSNIELEFTVDKNGELIDLGGFIAGKDVSFSKEVTETEVIYTADLSSEGEDHIDLLIKLAGDKITALEFVVRGYYDVYREVEYTEKVEYVDEKTGEIYFETETYYENVVANTMFIEFLNLQYSIAEDESGMTNIDLIIAMPDVEHEHKYDEEGNYVNTEMSCTMRPLIAIDAVYGENAELGATDLNASTVLGGGAVRIDVVYSNVNGEGGIFVDLLSHETDMLDFNVAIEGGNVTGISFIVRAFHDIYRDVEYTKEFIHIDPETGETHIETITYHDRVYVETALIDMLNIEYVLTTADGETDISFVFETGSVMVHHGYDGEGNYVDTDVSSSMNAIITFHAVYAENADDGATSLDATLEFGGMIQAELNYAEADGEATAVVDLVVMGNDVLDLTVVANEGVVTSLDVTVRGNHNVYRYEERKEVYEYFDEETGETRVEYKYYEERILVETLFIDLMKANYSFTVDDNGVIIVNAVLNVNSGSANHVYDEEGNYIDSEISYELIKALELNAEYSVNAETGAELLNATVEMPIFTLELNYAEEGTVITVELDLVSYGEDMLDLEAVIDAGEEFSISVDFTTRGEQSVYREVEREEYIIEIDEKTGEERVVTYVYTDQEYVKSVFGDLFHLVFELTENEDGSIDAALTVELGSAVSTDIYDEETGEYVETTGEIVLNPKLELTGSYAVTEDGAVIVTLSDGSTAIEFIYAIIENGLNLSLIVNVDGEDMIEITYSELTTVLDEETTVVTYKADYLVSNTKDDILDFELTLKNGVVTTFIFSTSAVSYSPSDKYDEEGNLVSGEIEVNKFNLLTVKYVNDYKGNIEFAVGVNKFGVSFATSVETDEAGVVTETIYATVDDLYFDYSTTEIKVVIVDGTLNGVELVLNMYGSYENEEGEYVSGAVEIGKIAYEKTEDGFNAILVTYDFRFDVVMVDTEEGLTVTLNYDIKKLEIHRDYVTNVIARTDYIDNGKRNNYTIYDLVYLGDENPCYVTWEGYKVFFVLNEKLGYLGDVTLREVITKEEGVYDFEVFAELEMLADEEGRILVTDRSLMLMQELLMPLGENLDTLHNYTYYAYVEVDKYEDMYSTSIAGSGSLVFEAK